MPRKILTACMLAMLLVAPAHAQWTQAKSEHFVLYSDGDRNQLKQLGVRLEKLDYLLRVVTGAPLDAAAAPVEIYMLRNNKQVQAMAGRRNIAGFYSVSDRNAYAVASRESKDSDWELGAQEILFHEYTHHFMLHHFPAAYPAWYVEGFAEYFSYVKFPANGSIEFGHVPMARVPGLVLNNPYPTASLFERTSTTLGERDSDVYYGTAWLLTHYFFNSKTRAAEFTAYLAGLAAGQDPDPDLHFEGGATALDRELKSYMKGRLSATSLKPDVAIEASVTLTPLDKARSATLLLELDALNGVNEKDRAAFLAEVRAAALKYPDSADVQTLLGDAEALAGNKDVALAAADRAIALRPSLARAYSLKASILLDRATASDAEADWKSAYDMIIKANRADTEDPVPLIQFDTYHRSRGGKLPGDAYDAVYKAYTILPQSPTYRFRLAVSLAERGHYADAARILEPLAYSPHDSGMRQSAAELHRQFSERIDTPAEALSGEAAED